RRDDLFAGQCRAAALDQLQVVVGFVGAVDVELQLGDRVQVVDRNAVPLQAFGSRLRAGHRAVEEALVFRQQVDEEVGGRAGADADDAAIVELRDDKVDGGLCDGLLELILVHGVLGSGRKNRGAKL